MKTNFTFAAIILFAAAFFTSCQTQNVASRFTSKYAKANAGKVYAQSSETVELGYAMLALTNFAQNDTNIVDHTSAYYAEVMNKFSALKNSKGVQQLNAQLSRNPSLAKSYVEGLYAFQMNNGRFGLKSDYRIDLNKIDFKRYGALLENFYKEAAFHNFYMQHEGMYNEMVAKANNEFTLTAAQKAVNAQGFHIIVSPLAKGTTTMAIKGHAYTEGVIFAGIKAEKTQNTPAQVLASRE
ncbi:DUF4932 domain-containing protein [Mucilaginibacter terrae]|uniref:DUF4932 domain-containing protein n=1 Tax=Mucilaginibacter terrae TaxID=1955052 RepID=A0ABU3GRE5_9SPHI|nr:DUF4932 domain-containing protein [Mucilaginibacter terrae]MDT3402131.1 hypothetical protein [Mucilaginibacter terrae]